MNGNDDGRGTLLSLAVKSSVRLLRELVCQVITVRESQPCAVYLQEFLQSVPPNYHAEFLDQLSPVFDSVSGEFSDAALLDFIDDLALILLSPSITHLDLDKYKYPTRNPAKYLAALGSARNLRGLVSCKKSVWKSSSENFDLLSGALTQMPMLRHLTLRYVKLPSVVVNKLLEGLADNSLHLTYLDLKHVSLTDSGLDPDSLKKFGPVEDYVDCIPALLRMKDLQHLNVSDTWLTYGGVKEIVMNLPLKSFEAIMDGGYDLQATVIRDLVEGCPKDALPNLCRTAYTIVPHEPALPAICTACPLLEHITLLHLMVHEVKPTFLTLSALEGLRRVTLSGLEWLLFHKHISLSDDPMPISTHVSEVSLVEPSFVDARHLGSLSICFPHLTHLRVDQPQHGGPGELWDCGPVFTRLTHLYYHGTLPPDNTKRFQRQQGLQTLMDVLMGWCVDLRSLTLYTDYIRPDMLNHVFVRNELVRLEELRLGKQEDLTVGVLEAMLVGVTDLRLLGRTDWWPPNLEHKDEFILALKWKYKDLVVFGEDQSSDVAQDPYCSDLDPLQ